MKLEGLSRVFFILIPFIIVTFVSQIIGVLLFNLTIKSSGFQDSLFRDLIITVFNGIGVYILVFLFVRFIDDERFIRIGLNINYKFWDIIIGLLFGLIATGGGYLIQLFQKEIEFVQFEFIPQKMIVSFVIFLVVALTEEIFFRGYILRNLLYSFNKYTSLIFSSLIFALFHALNPNMNFITLISLFLSGLSLGITYIYTKNLWFPIALHFSWNFFQTHLGFNVSGIDTYSIIEISIKEKSILNGGEFGFEGSILSLIFEAFILIVAYLYYNKRVQNGFN